jgi:anti-sigma B factor antagonist
MFGKVQRDNAPQPKPAEARESKTIAKFDQLGQTLVATLTVSTLSGADSGDLANLLTERIASSGDAEHPAVRHVVLDLQNVQYMDSMCIGVLVELLTRLREGGGRIALVNTAHNVEYLFKLTRLDRVFPICRDVMKAIEVVERAAAA